MIGLIVCYLNCEENTSDLTYVVYQTDITWLPEPNSYYLRFNTVVLLIVSLGEMYKKKTINQMRLSSYNRKCLLINWQHVIWSVASTGARWQETNHFVFLLCFIFFSFCSFFLSFYIPFCNNVDMSNGGIYIYYNDCVIQKGTFIYKYIDLSINKKMQIFPSPPLTRKHPKNTGASLVSVNPWVHWGILMDALYWLNRL